MIPRNKSAMTAFLFACVLLTLGVTHGVSNSKIDIYCVRLDLECVIQSVEPWYTNTTWYTNYYGTNMWVTGTAKLSGHVGPTIRLEWQPSTNIVVQESTNLVIWSDVRIQFLGVGEYYTDPMSTKFYRLRYE